MQLTLPPIERLDWSESTRRLFFSTGPGAVSVLALVDPTSPNYLQLERAVFKRAIGITTCSCGPGLGPGASPAPSRAAMPTTSVATGSSGTSATSTLNSRVSPPRLEPQHGTLGRSGQTAKGPSQDHEMGASETPLHVALFGTPPAGSSAAVSAQRALPVVPYLGTYVVSMSDVSSRHKCAQKLRTSPTKLIPCPRSVLL